MGTGSPPGAVPPGRVTAADIAQLRAELDRLLERLDALIARRQAGRGRPPGRPGAV